MVGLTDGSTLHVDLAREAIRILRGIEPTPGLVQSMVDGSTLQVPNDYRVNRIGGAGEVSPPLPSSEHDRSIELLKQWLSPGQLADFEDFGCFDVIGSDTGRRYRITDDPVYNIWSGNERICVVPTPVLSAGLGDRLLAQKIALETDESITLGKANRGSRRQSYPAA